MCVGGGGGGFLLFSIIMLSLFAYIQGAINVLKLTKKGG